MSSGDVAVANPSDVLGRKPSAKAPSRRSILAKMTSGEESENPVSSNTDAVLRARQPGSPTTSSSDSTKAQRSRSSSKQNGDANTLKGVSLHANKGAMPAPTLLQPPEDSTNGSYLRPSPARADSDNRSNASRLSARGAISNFLQKSRSRQSSQEPESTTEKGNTVRNRRSFTNGSRRLSLRMPSLKKGSPSPGAGTGTTYTASPTRDDDDGQEEIPPIPRLAHRQPEANGNDVAVSQAKEIPKHPSQMPVNGSASSPENGNQQNGSEEKGYVGSAITAVAGAGAAAGGVAAALASKMTGQGSTNGNEGAGEHRNVADDADDEEDSEEEFHDAEPELDDIEEEHEEEKHHEEDKSAHHNSSRRHRGLSEGEGVALGAGAAVGAGTTASTRSPGSTRKLSSEAGRTSSTMKRRSGSQPAGGESTATPTDQKAKKETPLYVREKAARVHKLTYDEVKMDEDEMRDDIRVARGALHLFLNSRMLEAEEIIAKHADRKLYYALGDALIAVIKGFMTFEPVDLAKAISYCKDSLYIASLLRKPSNSVASFGRFVRGTGQSPSAMANMTIVQRHAELIYAESLLLKAVMGILYSGDFFAFVSEALNMRNAYGVYRSLAKYVEWADKKASGSRDESIDEDFRSGVHLGNGLISLILGLLPGKVLKIMEVIGYTGDTQVGLEILAKPGGWSKGKSKPTMKVEEEGVRRQVCDMGILLYHLVISTFIPVTGVDIDYADKILHYNLDRYPEGVFYLYFSGRLYSTQARAEKAIVQYRSARDIQKEYVQLQHICYWDMALCHMCLTQWKDAGECFDLLYNDSNWSKCVYSYGRAANMYMDKNRAAEASKLFHDVPGKMQRIAGKSIPMEKYCARKANKFIKQNRLLLPAIEFSYIYHCLTNAPRYSLCDNQIVDISEALNELNEVEDPSQYHSGADEYWDDYCLAHFLRGVTLRYIAYPEKHAKVNPEESPIPLEEAAEQAEISLRNVIESSHRISTDHYLCYFAHYEMGRLRANQGKIDEAREQFQLILSGKKLETAPSGKHRYAMQNMCHLRSNGALSIL